MNRIILLGGTIFLSFGLLLHADESKNIKKIIEEGPYLEANQTGIKLSGYVDAGYTYNFTGAGSTINNRAIASDAATRGDFNLHAAKIALEKPLSCANELQAGFRVDVMIGEDASSLGTNPGGSNGLHMLQAYLQMRLPYGNGLDLQIGKVGALTGYEAPERPCNLNITNGNLAWVDPAWYTGVKAIYPVNDFMEIAMIVGNGNLSDNGPGLDTDTDETAIASCIKFHQGDDNCIQIGVHYAPSGDTGYSQENEPVVIGNILGNWVPKFAKGKLLFGFNTSLASFNDFSSPAPTNAADASTLWGVALYSKYQVTDFFSIASRAEYVHTDDDQLLQLGGTAPTSNDIWGWTGTLSFDVIENMMLRTEYRIDWGDDLVATTGANSSGPAHTTAVEVVYGF